MTEANEKSIDNIDELSEIEKKLIQGFAMEALKSPTSVGIFIGNNIEKLVNALESLYHPTMSKHPKWKMEKFIVGIRGIINRYKNSEDSGKSKCADDILKDLSDKFDSFIKTAEIPPNFHEIMVRDSLMTKLVDKFVSDLQNIEIILPWEKAGEKNELPDRVS